MSYKARCLTQCYHWKNGNSLHNHIDDECCPDFSCCTPGSSNYRNDYSKRLKYYHEYRCKKRKRTIKNII